MNEPTIQLGMMEGYDEHDGALAAPLVYAGPHELDTGANLRRELLKGPKAERQRLRQQEGLSIARGLAGDAIFRYQLAEVDGRRELVCTETGEVIQAGPGEGKAIRHAMMHLMGADPRNHAVGLVEEVHEDGKVIRHEEGVAQHRHSSRLNTNYMEAQRRRNRQGARKATRRLMASLDKGEWFQYRSGKMHGRLAETMMTLTLAEVPEPTFLQEIKRFNRAFTLLRKTDTWAEKVRGGHKGVEVKLSVASDTKEGAKLHALEGAIRIHAHGHLLLMMRWWDWLDLRLAWLECVLTATKEIYGVRLLREELLAQVKGGIIVDMRRVKNEFQRGDADADGKVWTHDEAVQECLKYITKPDDWNDLVKAGEVGRRLLLEIEEVERWPRMYELLGKARGVAATAPAPAGGEADRAFVHTACVNDGTAQAPEEDHPLDGTLPGLFEPQAVPKGGPEAAPEDSRGPPKVVRPPSWRQLMDTLPIGEWVAVVAARMASARRHIARIILERRGGVWFDLTGRALCAGEPERGPMPTMKAPRLPAGPDQLGDLWEGFDPSAC